MFMLQLQVKIGLVDQVQGGAYMGMFVSNVCITWSCVNAKWSCVEEKSIQVKR